MDNKTPKNCDYTENCLVNYIKDNENADINIVKKLNYNHIDDYCGLKHNTALYYAAGWGNYKVVKWLIENGSKLIINEINNPYNYADYSYYLNLYLNFKSITEYKKTLKYLCEKYNSYNIDVKNITNPKNHLIAKQYI